MVQQIWLMLAVSNGVGTVGGIALASIGFSIGLKGLKRSL